MLFNSLDYLAFLALVVLGFWVLRFVGGERDVETAAEARAGGGEEHPHRGGPRATVRTRGAWLRMLFVFVASCAFYMAWNPAYIGLILFSTLLDYTVGLRIHASEAPRHKKAWLMVSLLGNLGLLGVFKYFNFFGRATADVLGLVGVEVTPPVLDVLLPVGISFYTFQTLSYTVDVYRGRLEPTRNLLKFAFYVTFFPQLVAGPIVRAAEFLPQIDRPPWLTRERVSGALFLIASGLIKKVVFADFVSVNLVDRVFDDPAAFSSTEVVLGLYGFTLQIYADFSGYTDVARGSGMLFGLDLPENFDRPYQARSVAEFWRRWHMTLSTWLRDYLYFPLGGSQRGPLRTYVNLWLTLFLIGLWHGASWTFVIYGNLQALAVMGTRFWTRLRRRRGWTDPDPRWVDALKVLATLQFVVFSRILFRATSLDNAWDVTRQLFVGTTSVAQIGDDVWRVLVLGFFLHYVPRSQLEWVRARFVALPAWGQGLALGVVGVVVALFVTQEAVPYIYFQF
jgi:D-alanyl-lipoteichoic acid acyltransferase DltB (MBOAT superfamily)